LSATPAPSRSTAHQSLSLSYLRRTDVRTFTRADTPHPPNSLRLNLFADPHPLNPEVSIFYKNTRYGGDVQTFKRSDVYTLPLPLSPLAATLIELPVSVANKRLTNLAKPFRCNTYKIQGGRGPIAPSRDALRRPQGERMD
jgi:hypothetical protein